MTLTFLWHFTPHSLQSSKEEITSQNGRYKLAVMVNEEVEEVGRMILTGNAIPHAYLSLFRNGKPGLEVINVRSRISVLEK